MDRIFSKNKEYLILKDISSGTNKNIKTFLVEKEGLKFIAKEFKKPVRSNLGINKYNHYGRKREGSKQVFEEIKNMNDNYDFLVKYIDRFETLSGWAVIQEYVEGISFKKFLEGNKSYKDLERIINATKLLAVEIKKWHLNGFAHGDPHLDNVIIKELNGDSEMQVKLVDYCMIHHGDFKYCKKYSCFTDYNRIEQDLSNSIGKLGKGFKKELEEWDYQSNWEEKLSIIFQEEYQNE